MLEVTASILSKEELKQICSNLNRREMIPWNAYRRLIATVDAYNKLVEEKDEALEIILHERDTLDENDPVWVLDPSFEIVSNALDLKLEGMEKK